MSSKSCSQLYNTNNWEGIEIRINLFDKALKRYVNFLSSQRTRGELTEMFNSQFHIKLRQNEVRKNLIEVEKL